MKSGNIKEITPETKIGELLDSYPELEKVLIEMAPVFSKLKNPVLRKTIAKVTTVRQAAAVGNIQLGDMVNNLRKSAGYEILNGEEILANNINTNGEGQCEHGSCNHSAPSGSNNEYTSDDKAAPNYKNVVNEYDARIDLEAGMHPVGKVMSDLNSLNEGEVYRLITPFTPAPLMDKARAKGFSADSFRLEDNKYETYFYK